MVGAHVVILSPSGFRDPSIVKNFYKIVEHYQASFFSSVPTVLSALLEQPVGGAKIDSLNYAICGAAPLSTELFKRFEKHTGVKILEGYGLTEGACASAVNPRDGERKIGSIGLCMPYQRIQVGILDQDHQYVREANIGEAGNILIKGPNVFKGYVEPLHNQHAWVGDGWFNTGDLGRQDEDGYFWLTGRKKELIIRGGHNIDPQLIEEVFYQLDEVKLVAAVPSPHPRVGEVPVVYVQLVEGRTLSIAQLQEHAEKSIGERAAIPKQIFIIDSIPLTPVGKMFKPALRWDATKRAYQFALSSIQNQETKINITVGEDKTYGTRVDIFITSPQSSTQLSAAVRELLAPYSIHYELHFNAKS